MSLFNKKNDMDVASTIQEFDDIDTRFKQSLKKSSDKSKPQENSKNNSIKKGLGKIIAKEDLKIDIPSEEMKNMQPITNSDTASPFNVEKNTKSKNSSKSEGLGLGLLKKVKESKEEAKDFGTDNYFDQIIDQEQKTRKSVKDIGSLLKEINKKALERNTQPIDFNDDEMGYGDTTDTESPSSEEDIDKYIDKDFVAKDQNENVAQNTREKIGIYFKRFFGAKDKFNPATDSNEEDFKRAMTAEEQENEMMKKINKKTNLSGFSRDSMVSESSLNISKKSIPFLNRFNINTQYVIVGTTILFALGLFTTGNFLTQYSTDNKTKASYIALKTSNELQKIDNHFNVILSGKVTQIDSVVNLWNNVKIKIDDLKKYNDKYHLEEAKIIDNIEKKMSSPILVIDNNVKFLNANKDFLNNSGNRFEVLNSQFNKLSDIVDKFGVISIQINPSAYTSKQILDLEEYLQEINNNLSIFLASSKISSEKIQKIEKAKKAVQAHLQEIYNTSNKENQQIVTMYNEMANEWLKFSEILTQVISISDQFLKVSQMISPNQVAINQLDSTLEEVLKVYETNHFSLYIYGKVISYIALIILVIAIVILFFIYSIENYNKALLDKIENTKNQNSVLRLLNEMLPLQEGDLTKKTTVTDEITGAIADYINTAVDSLSSLVRQIRDTSNVMSFKTKDLNSISDKMLTTSEEQSNAIEVTGAAVIKISNSIKEISNQTEKSAQTAKESVAFSSQGAQQVKQSIDSMENINENISKTEQLMEKVSNSSKQISDILGLLSDITEETNILALNATVQAAKAGESGKGFKIVADSIQELADKAADATRKVGALISAVQTDIKSVEESVKKTSYEVHQGVSLSRNAGVALEKINVVSNQLSEIIDQVSKDAQKQAQVSEQISKNMKTILKTTEENKKFTQITASSISEISHVANDLGNSVQSFKVD